MRSYRFALTASVLYAEMQLGGHDPAVRERTHRGLAWRGSARSAPSAETMPFIPCTLHDALAPTVATWAFPLPELRSIDRQPELCSLRFCVPRVFGSDLCAGSGWRHDARRVPRCERVHCACRCLPLQLATEQTEPHTTLDHAPPLQTNPRSPPTTPDHPPPYIRPFGIRWRAEVNRHATRTHSRYRDMVPVVSRRCL